jgi:uncharacterized Ntn-hydrolase superfamily protein
MTYSIVARDAESGMIGAGLQSHFFAAPSVALFAEAGVGVICTQAFASRQYGALGLKLLRGGLPSSAVLEALCKLDKNPDIRQVGIVDAQGRAAAFTGARCVGHASHCISGGVTAQGNMLAAPFIADEMVEAYFAAEGDLADRILAALEKAQVLGGDARGVQSAGILIVRPESAGRPWDGIVHDERVDDHRDPLAELRRLVDLRREYRKIGAILFEEGPLFEDAAHTSAGDLANALEVLRDSRSGLGDVYYEATLWEAVLLARHHRLSEAATVMGPLLRREPKLVVFIEGLVAAGFIDSPAAAVLLQAR